MPIADRPLRSHLHNGRPDNRLAAFSNPGQIRSESRSDRPTVIPVSLLPNLKRMFPMSRSRGQSSHVDHSDQLEQLRDRYAEARRDGRTIPLETLLDELPHSARAEAFRELLLDELTLRSADGESFSATEYLTRFPHQAAEVEAAFRDFQAANEAPLIRSPRRHSRSRPISPTFDPREEFLAPPG